MFVTKTSSWDFFIEEHLIYMFITHCQTKKVTTWTSLRKQVRAFPCTGGLATLCVHEYEVS